MTDACRGPAGGSALAEQLINVYLSVFQLIMKGSIGHAAELRHAADAKVEAAKKLAKAGGARRRPSAREQRRRTKAKAEKSKPSTTAPAANQVLHPAGSTMIPAKLAMTQRGGIWKRALTCTRQNAVVTSRDPERGFTHEPG